MHTNARFRSTGTTLSNFVQNYMNDKTFKKINIKNRNKHIVSLYEISVNLENCRLWNQICPKDITDKKFEKIDIKIEIKI